MMVSRARGQLVTFSDVCQLSAGTAVTLGSPAVQGGGQPAGPRLPLGHRSRCEWPAEGAGVVAAEGVWGKGLAPG